MNIQEYLPKIEARPLDQDAVREMYNLRLATFRGFANIESQKGFVQPQVSLNMPKGQDTIRLLAFRTIEEWCEAFDSIDVDHRKEEAIDTLNYLWCLLLVDQHVVKPDVAINKMTETLTNYWAARTGPSRGPSLSDIGAVSVLLAGKIAETLRNRSWQNASQDSYFSYLEEFYLYIGEVMCLVCWSFESWEELYRFYIAKDLVLKFRLNTNY